MVARCPRPDALDEVEGSSGHDIERNFYKEIHEEVGIERDDISQLDGIRIVSSGTSNILIVGHVQVNLAMATVEAPVYESNTA
jgi:hypothetical protein